MQRGTARDGGGAFETIFLLSWIFGPDGLATHQELFPSDGEKEAIARFDELTGELPATTPSRAVAQRKRRVRPNAASACAVAFEAAVARRDFDAIAARITDPSAVVDHTTGTPYDREGLLTTWRSLLATRDGTQRIEPLATLGDSLVLYREWVSASGFTGRNFDVGPYDFEHVILLEVDGDGRRRQTDVFATDRLGDAMVRMYERYADLLPDGPARTRASTTARSVAAYLGRLDIDRMISAVVPRIEYHDHRHLGFGAMHGIQEFGPVARSLFEVVDDVGNRVDDVVDLRPDAGLLRLTNFGTHHASGGPY